MSDPPLDKEKFSDPPLDKIRSALTGNAKEGKAPPLHTRLGRQLLLLCLLIFRSMCLYNQFENHPLATNNDYYTLWKFTL